MQDEVRSKAHASPALAGGAAFALVAVLALVTASTRATEAAAREATQSPEVIVTGGRVRGMHANGVDVFEGIPYAAPPAGDLRWRVAQPLIPWRGTRDATRFGADCPQPAMDGNSSVPTQQSEDCLFVNVMTPRAGTEARRPVMVWVHGGAYVVGSGRSPIDEVVPGLVRRGVVLVTFNYRLGRFGFFAHPALTARQREEGTGNYWLSDQVAALRWVHDNIARFGGDPANVTIFGVSAGGSSVNALVASPKSRGLFAKAIVHSGGGMFNAARPLEKAEAQGLAVAGRLGVQGRDDAAAATLRRFSPQQILANEQGPPDYGAIVDGVLLRDELGVSFAKGDVARVAFMSGSTTDEASIFGVMGFDANVMKQRFDIDLAPIRPAYESDGPLTDDLFLRQVQTDFIFTAGANGLAALAARNGLPSYAFRFAYLTDAQRGRVPGVPHGGDIPYVFDLLRNATPGDLAVANLVQDYWVNFARTGDPNGTGLPRWPRFDGAHPSTLVIDARTEAVPDYRARQLQVWFDKWSRRTGYPVIDAPSTNTKGATP